MATTLVVAATDVAQPRRFTVEEYHRMGDAGILGPEERVELLRGEIILMSPINPPHNGTLNKLHGILSVSLAGRAVVQVGGPVRLNDGSEPEPDIAVLRWREDAYATLPVLPEHVLLVMEVSYSSLAYDRDVKALDYAAAGLPEYWLWDLQHQALLLHRDPHEDGYHQVITLRGEQSASPLAFPDIVLAVDRVLPAVGAPAEW